MSQSVYAADEVPAPIGPAYVRMQPIALSVIGKTDKVDEEVSILLDLELEPGKPEAALDAFRPRLLDSFFTILTSLYEDDAVNGRVSIQDMKDRLLAAATAVTGPGMVHQVLIVSIGERPHH